MTHPSENKNLKATAPDISYLREGEIDEHQARLKRNLLHHGIGARRDNCPEHGFNGFTMQSHETSRKNRKKLADLGVSEEYQSHLAVWDCPDGCQSELSKKYGRKHGSAAADYVANRPRGMSPLAAYDDTRGLYETQIRDAQKRAVKAKKLGFLKKDVYAKPDKKTYDRYIRPVETRKVANHVGYLLADRINKHGAPQETIDHISSFLTLEDSEKFGTKTPKRVARKGVHRKASETRRNPSFREEIKKNYKAKQDGSYTPLQRQVESFGF